MMQLDSWAPLHGHRRTHLIDRDTLAIAEVIDDGRRRRLRRGHTIVSIDGRDYRLLPERVNDCGYITVSIDGHTYLKHRLIAATFIWNPFNLPEVDHIQRPPRREREYVDVDEDELEPVIAPDFDIKPDTYFWWLDLDRRDIRIVKYDENADDWYAISVHNRGGYDRVNILDANGRNRMVQVNRLILTRI